MFRRQMGFNSSNNEHRCATCYMKSAIELSQFVSQKTETPFQNAPRHNFELAFKNKDLKAC